MGPLCLAIDWSDDDIAALRRYRARYQTLQGRLAGEQKYLASLGLIEQAKRNKDYARHALRQVRAATIILQHIGVEAPLGRIPRIPAELFDDVAALDPGFLVAAGY